MKLATTDLQEVEAGKFEEEVKQAHYNDQACQADLKDVSHDEISTKKEGFNVRIVNSNARLYNESEQRIRLEGMNVLKMERQSRHSG